jgi:hypothetical protein
MIMATIKVPAHTEKYHKYTRLPGGKLNLYLLRVCCCAQKEWEYLWPIQKAAGHEAAKRRRKKTQAAITFAARRLARSLALAHKNLLHTQ